MNQDKALWCLFLTCITTLCICFLVAFIIAICEYHSKQNRCSFIQTDYCKTLSFRPYLKHEAFKYDIK